MQSKTKKLVLSTGLLFIIPLLVAFFASTLATMAAGTYTWSGGAAVQNWGDPTNWGGVDFPSADSDIVFPDGPTDLNPDNDFAGTYDINSIAFNGSGYNITGNGINLAAGLADSSTGGMNFVNLASITLTDTQTFSVASDENLNIGSDISMGTNNLTLDTDSSANLTIGGDITGTGNVTKEGPGHVVLSGNNAQTETIINEGSILAQGVAPLGLKVSLNSATGLTFRGPVTVSNSFYMDSTANTPLMSYNDDVTINSVGGSSFMLNKDTKIEVQAGTMTINQVIGDGGNTYGLTKTGPGTLTLTQINTYSGLTALNQGTMNIYEEQGDSDLVMQLGTFLNGCGFFGDLTAIGGTVAPSTPIGITGNMGMTDLSLDSASTYNVDIIGTGPNDNDNLDVLGTVSIGGTLNITLDPAFTPAANDQFKIINNMGVLPISGQFTGLAEGSTISIDGYSFVISYVAGTDLNDVTLTAIASPPTWTGEGTDTNWTTKENWIPVASPATSPINLAFPDGPSIKTPNNDLDPDSFPINSIYFTGNNYTLTGEPINLNAGITDSSTGGMNFINLTPISLTDSQSFTVNASGDLRIGSDIVMNNKNLNLVTTNGQIYMTGDITGPGILTKEGPGHVVLSGNNAQTETVVNEGSILAQGVAPLGLKVSLNSATGLTFRGPVTVSNSFYMDSTANTPLMSYYDDVTINSVNGSEFMLNKDTKIEVQAGTMTINQDIKEAAGSHGITKTGAGTLKIANSMYTGYTGATNLVEGTLFLMNSVVYDLFASAGTTLTGTAEIGNLSISGTIAPESYNVPGDPATMWTNNLTLDSTSNYLVDIKSLTSYDQLIINGTVNNINGATLTVTLDPTYIPVMNDTFTIINNTGTEDIIGTFSGLGEGAILNIDGVRFQITYNADADSDGKTNDVVLTSLDDIYKWTGATDLTWAENTNWTPGGPIPEGANLLFNKPYVNPVTLDNNLASNFSLSSIRFTNTRYIVAGQPIALLSGILNECTNSTNYFSLGITLSGAGPHYVTASSPTCSFRLLNADPINLNGHDLELQGAGDIDILKPITGTGNLIKNGTGNLTLAGTNGFVGNTEINEGTILIGNGPNLTFPDTGAITVASGSTLDLGGYTETIGSLAGAGNINIADSELTVGSNNTDTTFSGIIAGTDGALIKSGTGTFTLTGDNTYTGPTTISGGKLIVNGSLASSTITTGPGATLGGTGTMGPLTVNSGGILTGTGTVGDVTVTGGTVSPGLSPGILHTGALTLDGSSFVNIEINGTTPGITGYDQIDATGNVILGDATLTPTVGGGYTPVIGDSYTIVQSTTSVTGTFKGLADNSTFTVGTNIFTIKYNPQDVTITMTGKVTTPTPPAPVVTPSYSGGGSSGGSSGPSFSYLFKKQQPAATQETQEDTKQKTKDPLKPSAQETTAPGENNENYGNQETHTRLPDLPSSDDNFYLDTNNHWAKTSIDDLKNTCLIAGYTDANGNLKRIYQPEKKITRDELLTILMKCKYGPLPFESLGGRFPDVSLNHWASPYIKKALDTGLVKGFADGTFKPYWKVPRAEAVRLIMITWLDKDKILENVERFNCSDVPYGSWYAPFFGYAFSNKLLAGFRDAYGNFTGLCGPAVYMTRGEAADLIMKVMREQESFKTPSGS